MRYSEAKQGRVFIIRLDDGDVIHEELEKFAAEHSVKAASLIILGGADKGSILITGPLISRASTITPMTTSLDEAHEILGVGTIFQDQEDKPRLHMHIA